MAGGGAYAITGGVPDGADTVTLTLRANYLGATVDQTIFVSKAKQGAQGTAGTGGTPGSAAIIISASKPTMMILCYAEGTPVDASFIGDDGFVTVLDGPGNDVTASCTFTATAVGCTGTVNTATNVPVAAHGIGYYRITAMSADNATLTVFATYAGYTYSVTISLAKAKGGYEIVGSLPVTNLFEGRIVFLTTDGKLYRYHGGAWTTAVPTADLSGLMTDGQILAQGKGPALNDDPMLQDPTAWVASLWGSLPTFQTTTAGVSGNNIALAGTSQRSMMTVRGVPTSSGKTYRMSAWIYAGAGTNGTLFLRIDLRDSTNTHVGYLTTLVEAAAAPVGLGWTKYSGLFTSGYPFGAPIVILNYGGTAGSMQVQDIRIEEVITGDLIIAGGVTATQLAAGSIVAGKIAANAVQAGNIQAGAIVAADIAANTITGNKMSAGAIITASAQITDGVIITAKIGLLQVNSAIIADLTVGTGKISANAVTRTASAALGSTTTVNPGDVISVAYTPDTTAPVRIDWTAYYSAAGGGFSVGATVTTLSLVRTQSGVDTTLWTGADSIDATLGDSRILSGTWVDNVANTIARTYKLHSVTSTGGGNSTFYVGTVILVTEIKK